MHTSHPPGWRFIDDQGTFELLNPQDSSCLYFPLANQAGMFSTVTPSLNGDAKIGQNAFLLLPVSVEDLHNTRSARRFWVKVDGKPWCATASLPAFDEQPSPTRLEAGFLWHTLHRSHPETGLQAAVTSFVPAGDDQVELMRVTLTNQGPNPLELLATAAIPIYGRSADNLRDHRHVTSLLHRTICHPNGVLVRPTMSFDERGHTKNHLTYAVLGADELGGPPQDIIPLVEDFIGEGGSLEQPQAVLRDAPQNGPFGEAFEGFESIGALQFTPLHLEPGKSHTYVLLLAILSGDQTPDELLARYGTAEKFESHLQHTREFWQEKLSPLRFEHHDARLDGWLQWVSLQPVLRRMMGNSFLPYHDYGRGGRGWRDLWQDLLALLLTERSQAGQLIFDNFAGVRLDGSNANIVGSKPGEFIADRNSIPRVWMDHGAWPLLTTMLYLDLTGDLEMLLQKQTYYRDHLTHRCQRVDPGWKPESGTVSRTAGGDTYQGTILEHLLVQHLAAFYNVGEHNLIRLEGGDWNDGLDMAAARGESVAFSALYAGNLRTLSSLCLALVEAGVDEIPIAAELLLLLDLLSHPVDYDSIPDKQGRLQAYFDLVSRDLTGQIEMVPLRELAADLLAKSWWLAARIRLHEWVTDEQGLGWFNGYYDNQGERVEGPRPEGARMTLTGQVFPLMAGVASPEQTQQIMAAADRYLYDEALQGFRLNTNFGVDIPPLGRAFAFAYGHKENGALFNHMAVMYGYALYRQGHPQAAWQVLHGIYRQSQDFPTSRMYPGIPEYFNPRGRGMYPFLTGSAAWYLFTLLTESFGVKGRLGDLVLEPRLVADQFSASGELKVKTTFAGKTIEVAYANPQHLTWGQYAIQKVSVNGADIPLPDKSSEVTFPKHEIETWPDQVRIAVELGETAPEQNLQVEE